MSLNRELVERIAADCGVSAQTVRNILASRKGAYAERTRQAVAAAAERLGYRPNPMARMLREGSSPAVGVLVPHLNDPYYMEVLQHLAFGVEDLGLTLMMGVLHLKDREETLASYRTFLDWQVRAFIVLHHAQDAVEEKDLGDVIDSSFLMTINNNRWQHCSAVWQDRQEIARLAAEHLVGLGHQRIGFLSYEVDNPGHDYSTIRGNARTKRLDEELEKLGTRLDLADVHLVPRPEISATPEHADALGLEYGRELARTKDRPTALVCWDERLAVRVSLGFLSAGGRVPEDLSILSYNHSAFAATGALPLTTVGVPPERYARHTIEILRDGLGARQQGKPFHCHLAVRPEITVRETTAPPGSGTME
jgi:LacI family transcriptional regulator